MVGRSMAIRSTPGALKPVVSTLALVRQRISPRLKAAMTRSRSADAVSPRIASQLKPRPRIASRTCSAWRTPAQNTSHEPRSAPWRTISSTAASVTASTSTAASSWPAMNSPPRLPTPLVSSCVCGPLRHHLAQVALRDHLGDAGLVGDVGEQRAIALVQHAAVEPVGRRGQADHLEMRVDGGEIAQEAAVHGVRGAGDEMRLVDQRQIAALDVVGALVDALDAGEQDLRMQIALVQPGRVDAGRRVRPQPEHLGVVLRDQLLDVGDDEDPRVRPVGDGAGGRRRREPSPCLYPWAARSADCPPSRPK